MNFYSKFKIIFIFLLFFITSLYAININALYRSACEREIGIILGVDNYNVSLLTLSGVVKKIPRYEIIYLVYYPLDTLPVSQIKHDIDLKQITIKTNHDNKIVDLISGWPVNFTEENISFLTSDGLEAVISRNSIWKIKISKTPNNLELGNKINFKYNFVHPYPFSYCKIQLEGNLNSEKTLTITPQQLLSEPVMIKKELDRLMSGHEKIEANARSEQFYPVSQVYHNFTSLGLWLSVGSRYGATSSRSNNLSPIIKDELSNGPFQYQQIFMTGSAPMPYSIHEEVQSQIYWRFKADYFHLSLMLDPNLFLVGRNYSYKKGDLGSVDERMNESFFLEYGFDYGPIALHYYMASAMDLAIKYDDRFYEETMSARRYGISYHNHLFKLEAYYGYNNQHESDINLNIFRGNLELYYFKKVLPLYSFIYRKLSYDNDYRYDSNSYTNYFSMKYQFNYKYSMATFLSLEYNRRRYGVENSNFSEVKYYPKVGFNGALTF